MSVWLWISLGLAVALFAFLVYALLRAEDFS
jgi:K+-transporting ATPase KdpF subunit